MSSQLEDLALILLWKNSRYYQKTIEVNEITTELHHILKLFSKNRKLYVKLSYLLMCIYGMCIYRIYEVANVLLRVGCVKECCIANWINQKCASTREIKFLLRTLRGGLVWERWPEKHRRKVKSTGLLVGEYILILTLLIFCLSSLQWSFCYLQLRN